VTRVIRLLPAVLVLAVNVWLNAPLFMPGELPFRGSIEGGYAGMARFVSEHPNPWGWNPLQYCGVPTQFMYLPGLPYATAAMAWLLPRVEPDYVYRLIVAVMSCLGPAFVYFFALHFTGSRLWSLAAALAYSLFSPSYGLFPAVEKDRGIVQLPWRMQVLAKYGEGPHNTGLALLPLALWAVWRAGAKGGYAKIFAAALVLAAIALTNWVASLSLAISCLLLAIAAVGLRWFRLRPVITAAALGYALACFWLTPSFIRTIVFNWPVDSFGYHFRSPQAWLLAGLVAGVLLLRLAFYWARGSFYFCLVTLGAFAFGWIATAFYLFGYDTIPESRRYALEFELFLILAVVEAIRLTMRSSNQTIRMCAIGTAAVMLLAGTPQLWAYGTQGWARWQPSPRQTTVEYRVARWLQDHRVLGRVFASGGLRFRLNSWTEIPQVGGGFETGLTNRMPVDLAYHIRTGRDLREGREAADTVLELKALGAEYVVVHGLKSKEYYRDYIHPERLAGALPVVYHEDNDTIYRLPARPLVHLTTPAELPGKDAPTRPWVLEPYVAAIEDPARPVLRTQWAGTSTLTVDGPVPEGRLIAVQVNADPGWRAMQDGRAIAIDRDNLGFMVLHAAAAPAAHIELQYRGTAEQRIMAVLSAMAWVAAIVGLLWRKRLGLTKTS
jgi:hypothetical protein